MHIQCSMQVIFRNMILHEKVWVSGSRSINNAIKDLQLQMYIISLTAMPFMGKKEAAG